MALEEEKERELDRYFDEHPEALERERMTHEELHENWLRENKERRGRGKRS